MISMNKSFVCLCFVALFGTNVFAVKISLPTKYVLSTSVVSTRTGEQAALGASYKVIPSPIEITKRTDNGVTKILFTALPRTAGLGGIDRSEVHTAEIPLDKMPELIIVIKSLPERMRKANVSPSDSSETIFSVDNISLDFITEAKWKKGYAEFVIGTKIFVLNDSSDIRKLIKALEELK